MLPRALPLVASTSAFGPISLFAQLRLPRNGSQRGSRRRDDLPESRLRLGDRAARLRRADLVFPPPLVNSSPKNADPRPDAGAYRQNSCSMGAHLTDEGLAMRKRMWLSLQT
jgi:hypothetical protein